MSRILRLMALCCAALCSQMTFAQPRVIGIDELFRLAEEQSMSIRSFESGAAAAAEGVRAARAERLPDVGVTVSASFLGDGRLWDRSSRWLSHFLVSRWILAPIKPQAVRVWLSMAGN